MKQWENPEIKELGVESTEKSAQMLQLMTHMGTTGIVEANCNH